MAADVTPSELPGPGDPIPTDGGPPPADGAPPPRSLRAVLLGAMLVLAVLWWLGASGIVGDVEQVVAHTFGDYLGQCGGG